MYVPIHFLLSSEVRVGFWEESGGDVGGYDDVDEFIDAECGQDFVGVEGEGAEGEKGAEGAG